jgi:hypothetical protein
MKLPVDGEALRPVQEHLDLRRRKARRAMHGVRHQDLELVPILGEELKLEAVRNRRHVPGLRRRLEPAHHEAADLPLL